MNIRKPQIYLSKACTNMYVLQLRDWPTKRLTFWQLQVTGDIQVVVLKPECRDCIRMGQYYCITLNILYIREKMIQNLPVKARNNILLTTITHIHDKMGTYQFHQRLQLSTHCFLAVRNKLHSHCYTTLRQYLNKVNFLQDQ